MWVSHFTESDSQPEDYRANLPKSLNLSFGKEEKGRGVGPLYTWTEARIKLLFFFYRFLVFFECLFNFIPLVNFCIHP